MPLSLAPVSNPNLDEFIAYGYGGADGLLRGIVGEGAVTQQNPLSLKVDVDSLRGAVNQLLLLLQVKTPTLAVVAPTGGSPGDLRRKDLVQFTFGIGISIKAGAESATPTPPVIDSDSLPLAELHLRTGMATIKDTDDAANGFIVDKRTFF